MLFEDGWLILNDQFSIRFTEDLSSGPTLEIARIEGEDCGEEITRMWVIPVSDSQIRDIVELASQHVDRSCPPKLPNA